MFALPVSGWPIVTRGPSGNEDVLLLDAVRLDTRLSIDLLSRVAQRADDCAADWCALPITDLDALLLELRRRSNGDRVVAESLCPTPGCQRRVDISFLISDYLKHNQPRRPRHIFETEEKGWFRLADSPVSFRLPICRDLMEIAAGVNAGAELRRRCIRPAGASIKLINRAERAMALLAPNLSGGVEGICPHCSSAVRIWFDVQRFVLSELRRQSATLFEEVHLLARHYHWPEPQILEMTRTRRACYAGMLREAGDYL